MSDPFLMYRAPARPGDPTTDETSKTSPAEADDWQAVDRFDPAARDWKDEARLALERWLETQPEADPDFPADMPAVPDATACDLLKVVGELTAVKQEVRGLGRSSARLAARAGQSTERLVETLQALADDMRAAGREAAQRARIEAEQPMLLELGDVREALREMVSRANAVVAGRRWRRFWRAVPPSSISAEALRVLARKLDAMLDRHGIETVGAVGDAFEARYMNVAGISRERSVDPGQVSAVVRAGFLAGNAVLRSAEVIVEAEEQT